MKQLNAKMWFVSACVVSLLVPAVSQAEYGSSYSNPSQFAAKFKAADSVLGKAGADLKGLTPAEAKQVKSLEEQIAELEGKLVLDEAQIEKLKELKDSLAKVTKINTALATVKKADLDDALKRDKENRDLIKSVQATVAPTPVTAQTANVDGLHQKCSPQEIQGLTQGWKATAAAFPQILSDLKTASVELLEGDKKEAKKKIKELKAKLLAEVQKAQEQAEGGDDLKVKAEKAADSEEDAEGTSFFAAVDKGIKVAKKWENSRSLQLVNTFFDALDKADERDDREAAVLGLSTRFQDNFNTFFADGENKFMAAMGRVEGVCLDQEQRMRGTQGQEQPSSGSLRGLQGQVVSAFERSFPAEALLINPQNQQVLAEATNDLSTRLERRGSKLAPCPVGMSSQVQTLLQNPKTLATQLSGQTDPQLLIDQAASTLQVAMDSFNQAGSLLDQSAGFCTAMATEVSFLEEKKSEYASKTGSGPGAAAFAGGPAAGGFGGGFPGGFGGFPGGAHR